MKIKYHIPKKLVDTKTKIWIGVVMVLLLGNVFMTIQTAATGAELAKIERESVKLAQENQALSDKLVSGNSLTAIEQKATQLGFGKPSSLLYLKLAPPVAQLPQ